MKMGGDLWEVLRSPYAIRTAALAFSCVAFFYLGKRWSDGTPQQPVFFRSNDSGGGPGDDRGGLSSPAVVISPNANATFNITSLIDAITPPAADLKPPAPPPPPPPPLERFGIVDGNGTMVDDFDVGEDSQEIQGDLVGGENMTDVGSGEDASTAKGWPGVQSFRLCPAGMREYIPCLDNVEAIRKLESTERGEKFERHCPREEKKLKCVVPAPKDYRPRIPWPRSRDEVT